MNYSARVIKLYLRTAPEDSILGNCDNLIDKLHWYFQLLFFLQFAYATRTLFKDMALVIKWADAHKQDVHTLECSPAFLRLIQTLSVRVLFDWSAHASPAELKMSFHMRWPSFLIKQSKCVLLRDIKNLIIWGASGCEITPCIKICKPLVV